MPPGWDDWAASLGNALQSEFDYQLNENGTLVSYGSTTADYGTDVLARKSVDFIRQTAATGQPFFLWLSLGAPHNPRVPAPRDVGMFVGAKAPRTPAFNEPDVSDKPSFLRPARLSAAKVEALDLTYADGLRSMVAVDEAVRAVHGALTQTGLLTKTYIIFTSDNGDLFGQHRLYDAKQLAYEESIRVPLLIRGPGVRTGYVDRSHLVVNADLAPTILRLAGLAAPSGADGRSFRPLLIKDVPLDKPWRQALPLERWLGPSGGCCDGRNFTASGRSATRGSSGRAARGSCTTIMSIPIS